MKSDIFDQTADFFEADAARWKPGAYHSGQCFCIIGAIVHIAGITVSTVEHEYGDLIDQSLGFGPDGGLQTIEWNDQPGRTVAEIVTALRDAANFARARGE